MSVNMQNYGLNSHFAFLAAGYPEFMPARIISQERGLYRVVCAEGERLAEVSGRFRYRAASEIDFPATGDFVMIGGEGERVTIHGVLPRSSVFIRKASGTSGAAQVVAANVDTVFICMSLNRDFNLRRLERYLAIGYESGAAVAVVLTKSDLCDDIVGQVSAVRAIAAEAPVIVTTSVDDDGYAKIAPFIGEGKTVALIGSSGVGKSTMVNRLIGGDRLATNGLRDDDRGRHTTTRRELITLPGGGAVIDTPGMRELGMWDAAGGVETAFSDIAALAAGCRYRDCSHGSEAGCAVRAALEAGTLSAERWRSYCKLKTENAFIAETGSYLEGKRRKFKEISKINKASRKNR